MAKRMSRTEAVVAWIRRWLGHKKHEIAADLGVNVMRLYEVWEEKKFGGTRLEAMKRFQRDNPELSDSTDYAPHRRKRMIVSRKPNPD